MKYFIQQLLICLALDPESNTLMTSYSVSGLDAYELSPEVLVLVEEETATILGIACDITHKRNMEFRASMIPGVKVVRNQLVLSSHPPVAYQAAETSISIIGTIKQLLMRMNQSGTHMLSSS